MSTAVKLCSLTSLGLGSDQGTLISTEVCDEKEQLVIIATSSVASIVS